jgi:hypothetical protein
MCVKVFPFSFQQHGKSWRASTHGQFQMSFGHWSNLCSQQHGVIQANPTAGNREVEEKPAIPTDFIFPALCTFYAQEPFGTPFREKTLKDWARRHCTPGSSNG